MTPLSVLIMTKNEEEFIGRCINSVAWADQVVVIDSGSTDRTREIAASLGASLYEQEWLGYAAQRQKGIALAQNDWILFLDADEIVTPELAQSIQQVMSGSPDQQDGYSLNRRGDMFGIVLPNFSSPWKRLTFVRLFNRRCSAYDTAMLVHEEVRVAGKIIPLQGDLLHWRAHQLDEWFSTSNRYATLEAEVMNQRGVQANGLIIFFRFIMRFCWCYLFRGGFRLGTRGVIYAMWAATAEFFRYAKLWEMQNVTRVAHPPAHIYPGISKVILSNQPIKSAR
jgi:glycosyltransferase involved in cell wall biosynthesis